MLWCCIHYERRQVQLEPVSTKWNRKAINEEYFVCICSRKLDVCKVGTRPNITYIVGMLGRYQRNPSLNHWKVAKKAMHYLQDFGGYVDAWKSILGYIFFLLKVLYLGEVLSKL